MLEVIFFLLFFFFFFFGLNFPFYQNYTSVACMICDADYTPISHQLGDADLWDATFSLVDKAVNSILDTNRNVNGMNDRVSGVNPVTQ